MSDIKVNDTSITELELGILKRLIQSYVDNESGGIKFLDLCLKVTSHTDYESSDLNKMKRDIGEFFETFIKEYMKNLGILEYGMRLGTHFRVKLFVYNKLDSK